FLRCPQDSLLKVPPERLPRRAVRGLGAHNPHQTGSFHPLKTTKCLNLAGGVVMVFSWLHLLFFAWLIQ
ncbi:MAG: hypothetical protein NTV93_19450, partial [Verrucomicrobia bacterium]|nr:hypothetical protein [Verrucomicrobiota bacterium]